MKRTLAMPPREALRKYFGYSEFRAGQEEIITAILAGKNVFGNLATAAGKSLCFQLPAVMFEGLTIVISPLIALMHDQVQSLRARNIAAASLDSTLTDVERAEVIEKLKKRKLKLLYVSPEQLGTKQFYENLGTQKVALLAVDEAHCISTWGHDFRRDYLKIADAAEKLNQPRIAALTATAPVRVREEIISLLRLEDAVHVTGDVDRKNLELSVEQFTYGEDRMEELIRRLRIHSKECEPIIVYTRRIADVEEIAERLEHTRGISYLTYHGKMEPADRRRIETRFANESVIIIATKAFGMGVDKPDVRGIYHYGVTESLDEWWQEVGRGGRDGHPCKCVLMYNRRDCRRLRNFIAVANPNLSFVQTVWRTLGAPLKPHEWKYDPPRRRLFVDGFVRDFAEGETTRMSMVESALAQLEEHEVIRIFGGFCEFLVTPEHVQKFGFPISETHLNTKRDLALQRLKIMLYFTETVAKGANPREIVLGHFNHNSIAELVKDMDVDMFYEVPEATIVSVLTAFNERDFESSAIGGYLTGRSQEFKGPSAGILKRLTLPEIKFDVGQIGTLGYLREVSLGGKTLYAMTGKGVEFLREHGIECNPPKSYTELRHRFHSSLSRSVLKSALSEWWSYHNGNHKPDKWWGKIREFVDEEFEVLGEKVLGLKLVANFVRKKDVLSSERDRDATTSQGKGVYLRDVKLMLNWLFDNKIVT